MRRLGLIYFCAALLFAAPQSLQNLPQPDSVSKAVKSTIEGLIRDAACPLEDRAATATKFTLQCALDCVKQGSPIIILTREGTIYLPLSDAMPDQEQRQRLLPFVGKFVRVSGTVVERQGTRGIIIGEIQEMKEFPLITDAK